MSQNDHQPDLTGPGSPLYQVLSDGVMLYTALPVLVFAVASEGGGQGVDDHDRVAGIHARGNVGLGDILDRLLNSADMVIGLVFAGDERPIVAHAIHELHRHIEGKLRDGSRYHAWNKDLWALTWAGILKPIMTVYEELRGFESKAFRQDVYTGLLQLGEGFRVRGLPENYDDFQLYWQNTWLPAMQNHTQSANFILEMAQSPPRPMRSPWLPTPVWQAITWPPRRLLWTGLLLAMPPEMETLLGIERTRGDHASIRVHRAFWRVLPRFVTCLLAERFFKLRFRYGSPAWRRHYSIESLKQYRSAVKSAKAEGSALPERPSVR